MHGAAEAHIQAARPSRSALRVGWTDGDRNHALGWSREFGNTTAVKAAVFLNLDGPVFATSTIAFGHNGLAAGTGIAAHDVDVRPRYTIRAVPGGLQVTW